MTRLAKTNPALSSWTETLLALGCNQFLFERGYSGSVLSEELLESVLIDLESVQKDISLYLPLVTSDVSYMTQCVKRFRVLGVLSLERVNADVQLPRSDLEVVQNSLDANSKPVGARAGIHPKKMEGCLYFLRYFSWRSLGNGYEWRRGIDTSWNDDYLVLLAPILLEIRLHTNIAMD
jgi:hypothetical protein